MNVVQIAMVTSTDYAGICFVGSMTQVRAVFSQPCFVNVFRVFYGVFCCPPAGALADAGYNER